MPLKKRNPAEAGKSAATLASRCLALWIERGGTSKSELELCVFYGSACRDLAAIDAHRQCNRTPGLHSRYVCGRGLPCLHGSPKLGSEFMQLASHRTNGIAAQHRQPCRSVKTAGQAGPPDDSRNPRRGIGPRSARRGAPAALQADVFHRTRGVPGSDMLNRRRCRRIPASRMKNRVGSRSSVSSS